MNKILSSKIYERYFFLIILITPFLEFVEKNITEFDGYITLQFVFYSILLFLLLCLLMFFSRTFFNQIDPIDHNNLFCIAIYLQFKFLIFKNIFSKIGIKYDHNNFLYNPYDGEFSLILIIFLTIIIVKLYNKLIFKNFLRLFLILNFLFLFFLILFKFTYSKGYKEFNLDTKNNIFSEEQLKNISERKNIYFVIFDAMTTLENYEKQFKISADKFRNYISSENLIYFKNTHAAYSNTMFSFTSVLNLNYVVDQNSKPIFNRTKLYPNVMRPNLIKNYLLKKTLDDLGYKLKWIGPSIMNMNCNQYNFNLCIDGDKKNNFEKMKEKIKLNSYIFGQFLSASPVMSIIGRTRIYKIFSNGIISQHEENDAVSKFFSQVENYNIHQKPHFFIIHQMAPHGPWIYNSDCSRITQSITRDKYQPGYSLSYQCVLKKIKKLINFVNKNDPEAIMIIQADHGHDFGNTWKEKMTNSSKNFNLLRLNKKCSYLKLKGKVDMINNTRIALACATGQKLELVEKKSFVAYPPTHQKFGKVFLLENINSENLEEIYKINLLDYIKEFIKIN